MPTYQLKEAFRGQERVLPGIGRTVNGVITTNANIESTLFELVPDTAPAASAPAPSAAPQVTTAPTQPAPAPAPTNEQTTNKETE